MQVEQIKERHLKAKREGMRKVRKGGKCPKISAYIFICFVYVRQGRLKDAHGGQVTTCRSQLSCVF